MLTLNRCLQINTDNYLECPGTGSVDTLMMKLPVSRVGWSTRWSATAPELVNVNT